MSEDGVGRRRGEDWGGRGGVVEPREAMPPSSSSPGLVIGSAGQRPTPLVVRGIFDAAE